jgi:hypothetical protein
MNTFKPIMSNQPKQTSSQCVFIHDEPKPIGHLTTASSTVSNLGYGSNSIMKVENNKTMLSTKQEESVYTKYTFHNAKEFRDNFKVQNTILENIWDSNFKKKNGYCTNCNIYGICKPINNKCLHNPRKFPFGLVVSIVEKPTKEEDFTYICYICYNEHLQIPGCMVGATAPMDVNDEKHNMHDEYMSVFNKYNKKILNK